MRRRIWLGILSLVIVPSIFAQPVLPSQDYIPGQVIFRIAPSWESQVRNGNILIDGWEDFISAIPGASVTRIFPNLSSPLAKRPSESDKAPNLRMIFYLSFEEDMEVKNVVRYLSTHPAILYVEPWYINRLFYQPSDARADTSGGRDFMWHLDQIKAREAWDLERNDTTVKVGIIDSGTWSEHPDLEDNLAYNYDDPLDGIDNDFDGYVDNFEGWDFGGNSRRNIGPGDNNPSIGNVHGLWVTGIIGAKADNEIGIPGLCFNCEYIPIKGAADDEIQFITHGYQGIIYAVEQGADVVNCSWGGSFSRFGQDVIVYTTQIRHVAIVAACGNSGTDAVFYPAAFPEVLSVANSSYGDTLFANSTYNYTVDLSAPGDGIASTFDKDAYWSWGGTSAASPVVAAAVALTKAHFPNLTPYQAGQRVRVSTDNTYDINSAYTDKLGTGRVNMYRALADQPKPSIRLENHAIRTKDTFNNYAPGDTFYLDATWFNHLDSTQNLVIRIEEGQESSYLEMIQDEVFLGKVAANDRFEVNEAFVFKISEQVPYDTQVFIKLVYEDTSMNYSDFEYISQVVNPTDLDVTQNDLFTSISSSGNFGFTNLFGPRNQLGVRHKGGPNVLYEGGLLLSDGSGRVSDRLRNGQFVENDFRIIKRVKQIVGNDGDFHAIGTFDDSLALSPIGLKIQHETFASDAEQYKNFVLFRYIIENKSGIPIGDIYSGLYADWDISPFPDTSGNLTTSNAAAFNENQKYAYSYDVSGKDSNYYGIGLISGQQFHTRALENTQGTSYTKDSKYSYLRSLPAPSTGELGSSVQGLDVAQFVSAGPIDLFASQKDSLVFVVMASNSTEGLNRTVELAKEYYNCIVMGKAPSNDFVLDTDLPKAGEPIRFSDQNQQADLWTWDFGNGDSSSLADPVYTFDQPGTYEVSLKVQKGICTRTFTQIIAVSQPTGLLTVAETRWELFPNPNQGRLSLRHPALKGENALLEWVNLHGQVMLAGETRLDGPKTDIHLPAGWPDGIYYLKLKTATHSEVLKVLLER